MQLSRVECLVAAGFDLGDPHGEAVGFGQDLDVAALLAVFAGVSGIDLLAL